MVFPEYLTFLGQIFGFLNSQIYVDAFPSSGFSKKKNSSQLFFPALGQSVASQPKCLAPGSYGLFVTLQCFRVMLASFLPWVSSKLGKAETLLVSHTAPRELRLNKHNVLSVRSALLPMDQGVGLLHWVGGLPSSRAPQSWGGVWARGSKNATALSYHC